MGRKTPETLGHHASGSQMALRGAVWLFCASLALAVIGPKTANASWAGTATGSARAAAQTVLMAATPNASVTNQSVSLSWTATTLSGGTLVTGYVVRRYDTALVAQTVLSSCTSVTTNSCTETNVPAGTWTYSVQATRGNWAGVEGARSSSVVVYAATLSITSNQKVKSAATVTGATLAGYAANDPVTFRLDSTSGAVLTGSITTVDAGGAASGFTVTIPSGTAEGSHTIVAIGGSGAVAASGSFLFDSIAPSNTLSLASAVAAYINTSGTIYFDSSIAGSFQIVDAVADAGSGPAATTFPTFTATRWTAAGGSVSTPSGGPYTSGTYSWTSGPAIPANQTVTGFDGATNSTGATIAFVADTTNPTIVAADVTVAPVGNTTTAGFIKQGGQYYVYANATDAGSGVGSMTANASTLTSGASAVAMVAGTYVVAGVSYGWRTAALTASNPLGAGNKNVTATATDNVGNLKTSPNSSAAVENTAPTGSITTPSNGFAAASATVSSNSADSNAGVYSAEFQYSAAGAGSWTSIAIDTTSPYSVTWDTTALTNGGGYDLRVITTDNASNTFTSATVTVVVDLTAPAAPSTPFLAVASDGGPDGDNLTNDDTPTFTGTAEAGSTVTIYDGVTQVGSGVASGGNWSVTTSTLGTGAHTITATATDAAGHASATSGSVVVTVDTTQPTVTGIVIANGNVAAKIDTGDTGTVTFSEQMDATTFCSTWTNTGTQTLTNATITIGDSGGSDTLSVATTSCTFGLGTWLLGDYVGGGGATSATFINSTISWNPTTRTISITIGTLNTSSTIKTGVAQAAQKYTGNAARTDLAGNSIVTTQFTHPTATGF